MADQDSMHRAAMDLCDEHAENDEEVASASTKEPSGSRHKSKWSRLSFVGDHHSNLWDEIVDQPNGISNAMQGRTSIDPKPSVIFSEIEDNGIMQQLCDAHRIIVCACGTSYNAALSAEYLIEQLARVPTKAEYASEFRYKHDRVDKKKDVVIVISQSGETADTLAALRMVKKADATVLAIVNDEDSAMKREADAAILLGVGKENTVASTKAFTATLTVLTLLALAMAKRRSKITDERLRKILKEMLSIPDRMKDVIRESNASVTYAARVFRYSHNFLFLGRGFNFPIAMEGALKMKEVATTHAEGYPAAEMKHGPIALIDRFMPVLFIAPKSDATYEKIKANVQEVLARRGSILVITDSDNNDFDKDTEYIFRVPSTDEFLFPIYAVVPLQLLALHIATMRSINVDAPANLKKKHAVSPSLVAKSTPGGSRQFSHVRTNTDRNLMRPLAI